MRATPSDPRQRLTRQRLIADQHRARTVIQRRRVPRRDRPVRRERRFQLRELLQRRVAPQVLIDRQLVSGTGTTQLSLNPASHAARRQPVRTERERVLLLTPPPLNPGELLGALSQ